MQRKLIALGLRGDGKSGRPRQEPKPKTCPICGTEFISRKRFCADECRREKHRAYHSNYARTVLKERRAKRSAEREARWSATGENVCDAERVDEIRRQKEDEKLDRDA